MRLVDATARCLERGVSSPVSSTLRDHAQVDGTLGYFQHRLRVYDREVRPADSGCRGLVHRMAQNGRSTF